MKELVCADVGFDCDQVIHGEDDEEVMSKAAAHVRDVHGMNEIGEETGAKVRAQIHDA
jgi:predicted small metal-binding protein